MAFVHGNVSYAVTQSDFSSDDIHSITIMCFTTQYCISIPLGSLEDTLYHASYMQCLSQMKMKHDSTDALVQIVCDKCKDVFENITSSSTTTSLQNYIQPCAYRVTLVKDERGNDGVVAESSSNVVKSYRWGMASVNLYDLDERATVLQKFDARQLWVSQDNTVQNKVHTLHGQTLFFKPCYDPKSPEIARELSILLSIADHQLHNTLRVSRLAGLVFLEDGSVAGLVLEWSSALPLADTSILSKSEFHQVWEQQVKTIVRELHRRNIVWGDVNPHNILVDEASAAWVIDFGRNHNVEFIDEAVKEIMAGDNQGVLRLFTEWLPRKLAAIGTGLSWST